MSYIYVKGNEMKWVKFELLEYFAEEIIPFRICAVEVDEENSIVEHMEKEHGLQKVLHIQCF